MRTFVLAIAASLTLSLGSLCQESGSSGPDNPSMIKFVAPAYPRSAKEARIFGKTQTRITVDRDGSVKEAITILAHRVFESYVLEALKQWRFKPSNREYVLEVTCIFEFKYPANCGAADYRPETPETYVSAELPTTVHITTDLQCMVDYQAGAAER